MTRAGTNPFIPRGWTGEIEIVRTRLGTPVVNTRTKIAKADPQRLWLLVMGYGSVGDWGLWPWELPSLGGIKQEPSTGYVLIHNASYPSLVQAEWWLAVGANSGPFEMIEGRANQ